MNSDIVIAAITGPHGLDGSVKLKLFTDEAHNLKRYPQLSTDRGVALTLKSLRLQGDVAIARFAEITDRNGSEHWRGAKLFVARADLPPAAADEIYHVDLVGMRVVTPDGRLVGTVIDIPNYGAGDLLDIRRTDGRTLLIPYRDVAVLAVDTAARCVTADPAFLAD
jgi:16S rRNA processing protein RimM